jgi:type VI secretion system protein ImpJ
MKKSRTMDRNSKIVWAEGMFLRSQHFQQEARWVESLVAERCAYLRNFSWGFASLEIDSTALASGHLAILKAEGLLPDGTPFRISHEGGSLTPYAVPQEVRNHMVYLGLPISGMSHVEVDSHQNSGTLARYQSMDLEVKDSCAGMDNAVTIQVAQPNFRLLADGKEKDNYLCLGVARILECRNDRTVVLDNAFIPPVLDYKAAPQLASLVKEITGLLTQRGDALSGLVSESGRGGIGEIIDFLLLQTVNRYSPLFRHFDGCEGIHPESLFGLMVSLAGDLATYSAPNKQAALFAPYRQDDLRATFASVMDSIRQGLGTIVSQNVVRLTLQQVDNRMFKASIADRTLLEHGVFVLSVGAELETEKLRRLFPAAVKIGAVEAIQQLVNLQLPGIGLEPMPAAPRQIPYHAGRIYFEVQRDSEYWNQLQTSGGVALHVAGDFPGLELELWAIRGKG